MVITVTDKDGAFDADSAVITVDNVPPDLGLSVDYDSNNPYPGKRIVYTLTYANAGPSPAEGVVLTATLPQDTDYVGSGWVPAGGGYYRRTIGTVGVGGGGSVTFAVEVDSTTDGRFLPGLTSLESTFQIACDDENGVELNTSDNQATTFIGIPDLVIDEIQVVPAHPVISQTVTFIVTIRNRGTGLAGNPDPSGLGLGFWVDLFIDPDPVPSSYPCNVLADPFFIYTVALPAGQTRDITFVNSDGLSGEDHDVYAKVDNFWDPDEDLWQQNSLVPESDEYNNIAWTPVTMAEPECTIFLPAVFRKP
jgi:uncharacterized repeat protein (TIGR01451 family)